MGYNNFECPKCHSTFDNSGQLKAHKKQHKKGFVPFNSTK